MNELQAKLSKRLSVVQESGLQFESAPAPSSSSECAQREEDRGGYSAKAVPSRSAPSTGVDFMSAISRRRATVDGDGETFESTPMTKIADVAAATASSSPGTSTPREGWIPKAGAADFRAAINLQRANVDDGGQTFESKPSVTTADASTVACAGGSSGSQVFESKPREHTADCVASVRSSTMQPPPSPELHEAARSASEAAEESSKQPVDEQATAAVPTPSRAVGPGSGSAEEAQPAAAEQEQQAAPQEEEEDEKPEEEEEVHEDSGEEDLPEQLEEASPDSRGKVPKTTLTVNGTRVSWLVGLSTTLPEQFESEAFAIPGCEPVKLVLRPQGAQCQLLLRGPSSRPSGIEAKLFAGKGWAKKDFRTWQLECDLQEVFDMDLNSRSSILCGVIFKGKDARLVNEDS